MAHSLRIYERRVVYLLSFTIGWVVCINSVRVNIIIIIMASTMVGFIIMFNIRKSLPEWKVTILVYFLPAVGAFAPYMSLTGSLYTWTPVKDPLLLLA